MPATGIKIAGHSNQNMFTQVIKLAALLLPCALVTSNALAGELIKNSAALVAAVRDGAEGSTIEIAPGTFELEAPLEPKAA